MTRIAVLADIHGNLPALEAVLNDLAGQKADQIIVAGDVVNYGPFSAQVMDCIVQEGWPVIRGNHELYMLDFATPRAPRHWDEYTMPPWCLQQLDERRLNLIAAWPEMLSLRFRDALPLRVVHGSPRSVWDSMYATASDAELLPMLAGVQEDTIVFGHTHLITDHRVGNKRILNPGSVGVPLDGIPYTASYMLLDGNWEGWHPTWRRPRFDPEPLFREYERLRFPEECGVPGRLAYREYQTARCHLYPFTTWRKAHTPAKPLSYESLHEYDTTVDPWQYTLPAFRVNMPLADEKSPVLPYG